MIRLIIADDDAKVRSAIELILAQDRACWEVISQVRDVSELLLAVEECAPNLLLLDWELPEKSINGEKPKYFDLADRVSILRRICPQMHIMVLSSKPSVKGEALNAGADSFVSKGDPPEVFLRALYALCEKREKQNSA